MKQWNTHKPEFFSGYQEKIYKCHFICPKAIYSFTALEQKELNMCIMNLFNILLL